MKCQTALLFKKVLLFFSPPIISGLLLAGSFSPDDLMWWMAWIALVPLMLQLRDRGLLFSFTSGWLTGSVYFGVMLSWLLQVPVVWISDFAVLIGYLGLYVGTFAAGMVLIRQFGFSFRLLGGPCLWVVLEYLRGHLGFFTFPLGHMGYSQSSVLPIIQIATFTGVYGVSFLILLVNLVLAEWIECPRKQINIVLSSLALVSATGIWGFFEQHSQNPKTMFQVAVIPGTIPQDERWDSSLAQEVYKKYVTGSLQAVQEEESLDMIAWPETAVMPFSTWGKEAPYTLEGLARKTGAYLVLGLAEQIKLRRDPRATERQFNSAVLLSPRGEIAGRYHKMRLFPFGEYLPFSDWFPWPDRVVSTSGYYQAGSDYSLFPLILRGGRTVSLSILICWETAFPDLVREFTKRGARILVNVTNEAWFRRGAFREQMMDVNVFRAVENRVSIIRSANYGLSGFINPWGRQLGILEPDDSLSSTGKFSLVREVPVRNQTTFYTKFGDVWVFGNVCVLIGGILVMVLRKFLGKGWRHKSDGQPGYRPFQRLAGGDYGNDGAVCSKKGKAEVRERKKLYI